MKFKKILGGVLKGVRTAVHIEQEIESLKGNLLDKALALPEQALQKKTLEDRIAALEAELAAAKSKG